jgi:hypothetical protein
MPPKDGAALVSAMVDFLNMSSEQRRLMGAAARTRAEEAFSEDIVICAYLEQLEMAYVAS